MGGVGGCVGRGAAFLFLDLTSISGPVLVMVLEKENAVADWRALIGPTDAHKAKHTHPHRLVIVHHYFLCVLF